MYKVSLSMCFFAINVVTQYVSIKVCKKKIFCIGAIFLDTLCIVFGFLNQFVLLNLGVFFFC